MKRFHVHLRVADLAASIDFYRMLFGCEPSVVESDYAKWMLDDPRVNFALSQRGGAPGVDHLGFQVDEARELEAVGARLRAADAVALAEENAVCCYARSDKYWAEDPQGVRWESFHSRGREATYSGACAAPTESATACCGPAAADAPGKACC